MEPDRVDRRLDFPDHQTFRTRSVLRAPERLRREFESNRERPWERWLTSTSDPSASAARSSRRVHASKGARRDAEGFIVLVGTWRTPSRSGRRGRPRRECQFMGTGALRAKSKRVSEGTLSCLPFAPAAETAPTPPPTAAPMAAPDPPPAIAPMPAPIAPRPTPRRTAFFFLLVPVASTLAYSVDVL